MEGNQHHFMEGNQHHFALFFNSWITQLEEIVQEVTSASREPTHREEQRALIARVLVLYQTYYSTKSEAAQGPRVLSFFSPPWMSSLGSAYLWYTGWKPLLAFRLVESLREKGVIRELSGYQIEKLEEVKGKAKLEEEKVEKRMERLQMGLAGKNMMELVRTSCKDLDGQQHGGTGDDHEIEKLRRKEVMMKGMMDGLEGMVRSADAIRMKTLISVIALLSPVQGLDFLASAITMQIKIMKWGMNST